MTRVDGDSLELEIVGLGIILYSPPHAKHIAHGEDYLATNYATPEQIQTHIQRGTIVCFGTGSPGNYILHFRPGYPDETELRSAEFKLRLGLHSVGGVICIRDLYDMLAWDPKCPEHQTLELSDGLYHVTLLSSTPASGIIGDYQDIHVYLNELDTFPSLSKEGIPHLCTY